ncbi:hypothetical protein [Parvibaculum sp.]|uniref:hypothetical protein n=1 Tax=Parvibaculum sp. TaxID=2024848 RepID=UPI001D9252FB|nr:hypothetical protein [Parvibaculum sp.]MBX3488934.1 hypothetical protein [Parvibaculum sp.]MCW5727183.1 hypothetical protein [Parvibaculum sp.]
MIESLMLMALGFFIATLFAIIAARLVWRRAVKVTERRLGAAGEDEIAGVSHNAELDALLARQRREIEPLHNEIAALNEKSEALQADRDRLRDEVEAANAEISARDARAAALAQELKSIGAALAEQTNRQDETRQTLKNLSETAARLAEDAAPAAGKTQHAPEALADDNGEADRQALAAIAASINRMDDENRQETAKNDGDTADDRLTAEAQLGDRTLAARIRALEAGVAN